MRIDIERARGVAPLLMVSLLFAPILMLWMAMARADNTAAATPTAGTPSKDYKVGAGDLLKVSVFGSPELSTDARVAESGTITCPLIGSVTVAGLSSAEIERSLATKFVDG